MIHLSVETSTEWVDLALLKESATLSRITAFRPGRASEILVPALESLFVCAGVARDSLSFVSSSRGPGTYTSIRVGHLFSRGLAYTLKVPHLTISPFEVLARQGALLLSGRANYLVVLLDARRGEVNAALFHLTEEGTPVSLPSSQSGGAFSGRAISPRDVLEGLPPGDVGMVGPGVVHLGSMTPPEGTVLLPPVLLHPSAGVMGALAFAEKESGRGEDSSDLLYGRDSVFS